MAPTVAISPALKAPRVEATSIIVPKFLRSAIDKSCPAGAFALAVVPAGATFSVLDSVLLILLSINCESFLVATQSIQLKLLKSWQVFGNLLVQLAA